MKILIVAHSIYDDRYGLNSSKVGLAVIIGELCRNFSKDIKVDVFTTGCRMKDIDLGYAHILSSRYTDLISGFFKINTYISLNKTKILKKLYNSLISDCCFRHILNNHYDIVNIHDLSRANMQILRECLASNILTVVTLHIYIGNSSTILSQYDELVVFENYLIEETSVPIIVVSSGLKTRILRDHPKTKEERIHIISNGTEANILENNVFSDDKFKLIENRSEKILLCIGTINQRKNQLQLLEALSLMQKKELNQIKILFIGKDLTKGEFQREIKNKGLNTVAYYLGEINRNDLEVFYKNAYGVISVSLNEAFGLTFIEGFRFGLPSLYFDDIDAAEELYSEDAVVLIKAHETYKIVDSIIKLCNTKWDKNTIIKHSKKFDIKNTADKYEKIYRTILEV